MKTLTFLFLFVWFTAVSAAPLVVSDIDDTIKVSRVLSWGGIGSVFSTEAFWGMPELYRELAAPSVGGAFVYLSTAPKEIMGGSHEDFVRRNGFPTGPMFLEPWFIESEFKERTLRSLLEKNRPTDVVLIGDNGQRDAEIYDRISREFSPQGVRFQVFIRQAYSRESGAAALFPGQVPFVTGGEIALALAEAGMLPWDRASFVVGVSFNRPGNYWRELERDYPGASLGLPDWTDCRDHRVRIPADVRVLNAFLPFFQKIHTRCLSVIED